MVRRPSDDALVLCWREGTAHATNDGQLRIAFSDDDGATWTAPDTTLDSSAVSGFPMNPTVSAGQDAGEPWLYVADNGDLLLHMWRIDYGVSAGGSWQSRSTDGGETWSAPALIEFTGITGDSLIFSTDDHFVSGGSIYASARIWDDPDPTESQNILIKSDDDGATWDYVSDITSTTENTQEVGLVHLGSSDVLAVARTLTNDKTWTIASDNLGSTWGAPYQQGRIQESGRHRIYRVSDLGATGDALIMVGFVLGQRGSSHPRTNAIWLSTDSGDLWHGPYRLDDETEDAGYGDAFYDATNDQYVIVTYQGSLSTADLKQYRLTISGV